MLSTLMLSACAWHAAPKHDSVASSAAAPVETREDSVQIQSPSPAPIAPLVNPSTANEATGGDDLWSHLGNEFALTIPKRAEIAQEILAYSNQRRYLHEVSLHARPFLPYVVSELRKRHLPLELALIPILESGYNPALGSSQGPAGLWQLMGGTGTKLGLQQSQWVDQRFDPAASTAVALTYFQQLNNQFDGNWLLTVAAYNAGDGTVQQALVAANGRTDVWSINLPAHTQHFVARWAALREILRAPHTHGIDLATIRDEPYFAVIPLTQATDLSRLAAVMHIDDDEMRRLNPGFRHNHTGPVLPVNVLVPQQSASTITPSLLAGAASAPLTVMEKAPEIKPSHYTVRTGDSLWTIARRFNLHVSDLERANNLRRNMRLRLGQVINLGTTALASHSTDRPQATPAEHPHIVRYRVRNGDSLWTISRQFKVTIEQLLSWNNLQRTQALKPGQEIVIRRSV